MNLIEKKMTSSRYGPFILGYICATKVITIRDDSVIWSKSLKITLVRISFWNLEL